MGVSIPFKREGLSEPNDDTPVDTRYMRFQFPSNGKVFPNKMRRRWLNYFFLCFNSLQTGRSFRTCTCHIDVYMTSTDRFQFPSNGKVFPNLVAVFEELRLIEFQFPSNGKVFPNWYSVLELIHEHLDVSIPFKREGLSEQKNSKEHF